MTIKNYWDNLELSTRLILFTGLLIQVITAINAIGYLHPDQHFQLIEFASYKLGLTEQIFLPADYYGEIRPSLQVYIFLVYYKLLQLIHLDDPFTAMLILRILVGLLNFAFFSYLIYQEHRESGTRFINVLLVVSCFSWSLPFIRVLFSAEVIGGLIFYTAIFLYQRYSEKKGGLIITALLGVVLAMAFYIRFQLGFALVGFAIWLLFKDRISINKAILLIGGFTIGFAINVLLDGLFYGDWVLTPFTYFKFNILEGGASGFGESSVWYYVGILAGFLTAPPLSIVLFFILIIGFWKRLSNVYTLTALFFLLGHFMVGHKEERFLFSVFGVLPIILGYGMKYIHFNALSSWLKKGLKVLAGFSLILNFVLLMIMATIPVSQNLEFVRKINTSFGNDRPVIIKYYKRSPLETPTARNVHRFYEHGLKKNIQFEKVDSLPELYASMESGGKNTYYALTYDVIAKESIQLPPTCTEVLHSSLLFSAANRWLNEYYDLVVAEDWILYQCK